MNLRNIKSHLEEAREELDRTLEEINSDSEYHEGTYIVAISHVYHHINSAWNSRDASEDEVRECSEKNFKKWRKFPKENEVLL